MIQISNEHQAFMLLESYRIGHAIGTGAFADMTGINMVTWNLIRRGDHRPRSCFRQLSKLACIASIINMDLVFGDKTTVLIRSDRDVYLLAENHRVKNRIKSKDFVDKLGVGKSTYSTLVSGLAAKADTVPTSGIGLIKLVAETLMQPVYIKGNKDG